AGELAVKMRHLGVGERQELEALLLARDELLVGYDRGLAARLGIEAVFVQATQPRALHVLGRARIARRTSSHGMHETCVVSVREHAIPSGEHSMRLTQAFQ